MRETERSYRYNLLNLLLPDHNNLTKTSSRGIEPVQNIRVHLALVFLTTALLILPAAAHGEAVSLTRNGDTIEIQIGGKPFTVYTFDPKISKAFLEPLRDANGVIVTRGLAVGNDIPPGHEHDKGFEPHQRAMYFGHGDVDGYSFWIEEAFKKYYTHSAPPAYGRMVFRKIDEMRSGSSAGVIRATFDLEGADHKVFAQETQEYKFSGDKDSRIIDCEFVIKAGSEPVKFGDTKEGTFAVRLAPELDAPGGTMVNSEGGEGESQVWGKRANWVNVDGVIDGQKLGVAVFDNPDSFRHPTYWHARGYGLLAANPFGLSYFYSDPKHDGSYTVPAGKSIQFHYRVLIHEGSYKDARVAEKYSEYAAHR
jgi:Methane oxygenase PmoA